MTKIWINGETEYKNIVGDYNDFLGKFGVAIVNIQY